jgi:hypothetical protein
MAQHLPKCSKCERRNKRRPGECKVMKVQFGSCWAYTDDPDWEVKVRRAVAEYSNAGRKYNVG